MKRTTWKQAYQKAQDELQAERSLRMTFERIANRKADENRVLQQNNEQLEREARNLEEKLQAAEGEAETMRNLFCGLRERIYTLLRSADQDAEVFGLPRYTLLDIKTLEQTSEGPDCIAHPDRLTKSWQNDFWEWYKKNASFCCFTDHGQLAMVAPGFEP
jgi:hypothetical protein